MPKNIDTFIAAYCKASLACCKASENCHIFGSETVEKCKSNSTVFKEMSKCFTEKGVTKMSDCYDKATCKDTSIDEASIGKCMSL
jgi:hypothetical protein